MAKKKSKKRKKKKRKTDYESEDIYVLKGLKPVRKNPAMYIGSTGPSGLHHLIWECLDNSIDEAIMGHCNEIEVALLPDHEVRVTDNGRGVPISKHPQTKKSGLETVMTTLHAGAKFGGKAYQVAGGLHGVGVSVVCALSKWARAEVCREGKKYVQEYARGKAKTKLKKKGSCSKTGTTISFKPDPKIFKEIKFDFDKVLKHLRQQAYLTKGVKITVLDQREDKNKEYTFYFEGGLRSYVKHLAGNDFYSKVFYCSDEEDDILIESSFVYTENQKTEIQSFANNIHTQGGGTHLSGFKAALTRTINDQARTLGLLKEKDENLAGEDIRENIVAAISVKIKEPQFEGQTKAKLGNRRVKSAVQKVVSEHLSDFLEKNPSDAKSIIQKSILAKKARKAAKVTRNKILRKGALKGFSLPGKLSDCSSRKAEESELYIVEGESAGGSSRLARDQRFQAILPLKGKILNVERVHLDRVLASEEIKSLIVALGTAVGEDFNISKLRYHRIIIMADGDSDGNHIVTLLLTLFYRYLRPIIEEGYLYIAQPPLYQIKKGKRVEYAYTEGDKAEILDSMKGKNIAIQRYKGLGEMNPEQLWETTMNPENRILMRVTIEDAQKADKIFSGLMGKKVAPRKKFIKTHAKEVTELDV